MKKEFILYGRRKRRRPILSIAKNALPGQPMAVISLLLRSIDRLVRRIYILIDYYGE